MASLKKLIDERIKEYAEQTLLASVLEVNEEERSCRCAYGAVELDDVRLNSIIIDKPSGLVLIPKVGSIVLLGKLGLSNERYIAQYSAVDKLIYKGEKVQLLIDDATGEIVFNENRLASFVCNSNALQERLNAIEKDLNVVKDVFAKWVPAPQDGGGALKGSISSWAAQALVETTQDDIKDELIKN